MRNVCISDLLSFNPEAFAEDPRFPASCDSQDETVTAEKISTCHQDLGNHQVLFVGGSRPSRDGLNKTTFEDQRGL